MEAVTEAVCRIGCRWKRSGLVRSEPEIYGHDGEVWVFLERAWGVVSMDGESRGPWCFVCTRKRCRHWVIWTCRMMPRQGFEVAVR